MKRMLWSILLVCGVGVGVLAGPVAAAPPPDIEVHRGDVSGVNIPNGGSFAMGQTVVGAPFIQYFVVGNTSGTDDLHITSVTAPAGFTITQAPPATIHGGAAHGLNLRCDAAAAGSYSGNVVIVSDDPDESPFEVAVSCTVNASGSAPTMRLVNTGDSTALADGGTLVIPAGAVRSIRIYNDEGGDAPLVLSTPVLAPSGPSIGGYVVDDVVAVGGMSMYFNIRCSTTVSSSGTPVTGTFQVSIANNTVGSTNPYTFTLICGEAVPVTDPPVTDPQGTNPPATVPPGTDGSGGAGSGGATTPRGLPATGTASPLLAWVAMGAVVAGAGLVRVPARARRKDRRSVSGT